MGQSRSAIRAIGCEKLTKQHLQEKTSGCGGGGGVGQGESSYKLEAKIKKKRCVGGATLTYLEIS